MSSGTWGGGDELAACFRKVLSTSQAIPPKKNLSLTCIAWRLLFLMNDLTTDAAFMEELLLTKADMVFDRRDLILLFLPLRTSAVG